MNSTPGGPGAYLHTLVGRLGCAYGAERSVKFIPNHILPDRELLSIHKDNLGADPGQALVKMLDATGFPKKYLRKTLARLPEAENIHFGYEGDLSGYIYKCYLEFTGAYQRSKHGNAEEHPLIHYAVKWDPDRRGAARIGYYHSQPVATLDDVRRCLAQVYRACPASGARAVTLTLLSLPAARSLAGDLMLMLVTEEGNKRLSFDVNLYDAELTLAAVSAQLDALAAYFNVDMQSWRTLMAGNATRKLGHLAGGLDGTGREFFTVYFGVEERTPV